MAVRRQGDKTARSIAMKRAFGIEKNEITERVKKKMRRLKIGYLF